MRLYVFAWLITAADYVVVDGLDVKYSLLSSQRRSSLSEISLPNSGNPMVWMPPRYDTCKSTFPVSPTVRRRYRIRYYEHVQCPSSCRTQRLGVLTHLHHFRRCRVTFNLLSNQKFVQGPSSRGPAIDVSYHMGIRTALYNYFTTQVSSAPPPPSYSAKGASAPALSRGSSTVPPSEYDIYDRPDNTSWTWHANCSSAPRQTTPGSCTTSYCTSSTTPPARSSSAIC